MKDQLRLDLIRLQGEMQTTRQGLDVAQNIGSTAAVTGIQSV